MTTDEIKGFRLSPQQRRLWELRQAGGGAAYRAVCAVRVRGELRPAALEAALARVAARHEILRTALRCPPGVRLPLQVVEAEAGWPLTSRDLAGLPAGEIRAEVDRAFARALAEPFDPVSGSPVRAELLELGAAESLLVLSASALHLDGAGLRLLVREIARQALGLEVDEEPIQYADLAEWQNGNLEAEESAPGREHWQRRAAALPPAEPLPWARRPVAAPFAPVRATAAPAPEVARQVAARAAQAGPFLLACWHALLGRLTGSERVAVGTLFDGRNYEELELALGTFCRTLPIALAPLAPAAPLTTLPELVAAVEAELREAATWQECFAGEDPVACLPFGFVLESVPEAFELAGVSWEIERELACSDRFEARLVCRLGAGTLEVHLDHDPEAVDARLAGWLLERFTSLVESALARPQAGVGELAAIGEGERRFLLAELGRGEPLPGSAETCIHELVAEQARRHPEALAVVCGGRLTYGELVERAGRLAGHLVRLGVGPETVVGVCLERSPDLLVAVLGALQAGGCYLPLDSGQPAERLAFQLDDAGATVLVTQESLAESLPRAAGRALVRLDADWPAIERAAAAPSPTFASRAVPGNAAYMIFTSGSTGNPKGVIVEHRQLAAYVGAVLARLDLPAGASFASVSTPAADLGHTAVFPALCSGGTLHLVTVEEAADPAALAARFRRESVDCLKIVPSHLAALLRGSDPGDILPRRRLVVGGEATNRALVEEIERLAGGRSGWALFNHYGPTETTVGVLTHRHDAARPLPEGAGLPLGRPIPGARIYLVDEHLRPAPAGCPGELLIGGAGVARGYAGRPALTAERFVPDPFSGEPGQRLYRTGDLARWSSEGQAEFLGRIDRQVKIHGYRVEPGEVEVALVRHPAVRQAAVVVRDSEDREADGSGPRLVAYLVAQEEPADAAALRDFLRDGLPEFMVPSAWVWLDALPLTPNGKLDRRALPEPAAVAGSSHGYAPPRNRSEETLCRIWQEVLRLERVGVHDNFFELGGDSILSIQIIARASRSGLRFTPKQIFRHQTVAELVAVAGRGGDVDAEQGLVTGEAPLLPIQQRFFALGLAEPLHYNQNQLLAVAGTLEPAALTAAMIFMQRHHDSLRLRFRPDGAGGWHQEHAGDPGAVSLVTIDLSALPAVRQSHALEAAGAELQAGLDFERGPIWRAALFRAGGTAGERLLLVVHHLAVDAVSWRVLLADLEAVYVELSRGRSPVLPPKTTSYRSWAERLAAHARSDSARAELAWWTGQAEGDLLRLPVDGSARAALEAASRTASLLLEEDETAALLREATTAHRAQIQELLLTALACALAPWAGDGLLPVDLEGHGREDLFPEVDLSRTVGWFTTLYPVFLELETGRSAAELLPAVRDRLRALPGNGLGFGLLRHPPAGGAPAVLAELPRSEIRFNYLGQMDEGSAGDALLRPVRESVGPSRSPRGRRQYLLDVTGAVVEGRLWTGWSYAEGTHRRETIEALAGRFGAALRALIAEAGQPPVARTETHAELAVGAIEDLYPLSPVQQGLLYHSLAATEAVYVEQEVYRFRGALDVDAFERAWREVIARHPALRTAFLWEDREEPVQAVFREARLPLEQHDWRALTPESGRLESLVEAGRASEFDLTRAPLLRHTLVRLADDEHCYFWSFHHLILDGWSRVQVLREVIELYQSLAQDRTPAPAAPGPPRPPTPAPPRPYRDYIDWLRRQDLQEAELFWRRELAGIERPTQLALGVDPDPEAGWGIVELTLSTAASTALRELGRRQRLTLNTVLQGAWGLLLCRYSGEESAVLGATVSGRPAGLAGAESMVGLFINTLPVRVQASADAELAPWLRELQERQLEMRRFEHSPLVQVQGWSEIPRGTPLFESVLVFENFAGPGREDAAPESGLQVEPHELAAIGHTNYPLVLLVGLVGPGGELGLRISHDRRRFGRSAVRRLLAHLTSLLAGMPGARTLRDLSPLTAAERHQLLVEWNDTELSPEPWLPAHRRFEEQAARTPELCAVEEGEERLTYRELNARANRLARHLLSSGLAQGAPVGVCLERSSAAVVALLGVLKAGGVYLPLDPAHPDGRLAFLLEDSQVELLVTLERWAGRLSALAGRPVTIVPLDAEPALLDAGSELDLLDREQAAAPHDPAYLIYTSGTTGQPKAVVAEHRNLAHVLTASRRFDWREGDRMPCLAPLSFDISLFELLNPLLAGGTCVLVSAETILDLGALAGIVERATAVHAVPALMRQLVDAIPQAGAVERFRGLRSIFVGGDSVPTQLLADLRELFPAARIHVLYGPTEGTIICSSDEVPREGGIRSRIGRPLAGCRLDVLDRWGDPVPVGVSGEIHLGGGGVARGYWRREALTAEKFVELGEQRFYRTGDLARRLPDGALEFLGRIDQQVKIRGFRVEPGEVEAVLMQHPAVTGALVLVREAEEGSTDRRLVAYVAAAEPERVSADELRRLLRERLPEYMMPSAFVRLASFPLTANSKVDRRALPAPGQEDEAREITLPRTAEEESMAAIWREVLRVERVGVEDDFFALGGHSLMATQVLSRTRAAFGVELSLRSLFDAPTLAGMAAAVGQARAESALRPPAATAAASPVRVSREARRVNRAALELET